MNSYNPDLWMGYLKKKNLVLVWDLNYPPLERHIISIINIVLTPMYLKYYCPSSFSLCKQTQEVGSQIER